MPYLPPTVQAAGRDQMFELFLPTMRTGLLPQNDVILPVYSDQLKNFIEPATSSAEGRAIQIGRYKIEFIWVQ